MEEKIYKPKDLPDSFDRLVSNARYIWKSICEENIKKYEEKGSCIIGAGVYIRYIPKRKRNWIKYFILDPSWISGSQTASSWEPGMEEVLKYLHSNGIEAFYHPGRMD